MHTVNIAQKFSQFNELWSPKILGEINDSYIKAVKVTGEFVWHHHDNEDELFYVVKGSFDMEFLDKTVTVNEGEFIIVPRGVEHRPNAKDEVHVVLFEPGTTLNTGNIKNEMTMENLGRV